MTKERYDALVAPLRAHPHAVAALKGINRALTMLCYVMYPLLLAWLFLQEDERLLRCIAVPAASFVAVSIFRALYNAPRPYELGIDPLIPRKKAGHSFPSRHVFSACMIAVTYWTIFPQVGMTLLAVGVFLAIIRVVAGIHFPKDVVAGAICALAAGGIGFWCIPW